MTSMWSALTMVLSIAFTGVLVEWIARARHARRLFFVDLGRERTPEDDARATRLRVANAIITAAGVALSFVRSPEWVAVTAATAAPLLSAAWLSVEVLGAARSATRERVPGRFVVSLEEGPPVLAYVSAPLEVLNVLVILVPSAVFAWLLARLPSSIPAHWNVAGEIDRYASPNELWTLPAVMLFDLLLLWGLAWAAAKERWALPEQNAERYRELSMDRRRTMVRMIEWMFLAIDGGMAVVWMGIALGAYFADPTLVERAVVAGVIVSLAGSLAPLVVYAPRLVRLADELRKVGGSVVLGTHPSGWRYGGLIYYAPEDPALFVPKRDGLGQTVNMARPGAWAFLAALVLLPIVISLIAIALAG